VQNKAGAIKSASLEQKKFFILASQPSQQSGQPSRQRPSQSFRPRLKQETPIVAVGVKPTEGATKLISANKARN
jgi:hypothetical protein